MPSKARVLTKALLNASKEMGISITHLEKVIGNENNEIKHTDINPQSKPGELALMLIRCYNSLYLLVGSNKNHIQHWMHTYNNGTHGVPAEQISNIDGLLQVAKYLEIMSRKVK